MVLLSLLLRLLIEKPHGTVNSQGKRKGLVVIIGRLDQKGWFSCLGAIISYNASSKGTNYMADIMDSRYIFHFTSSWSHLLKNLLYKTMCLLPRCTQIYMTKMPYQTLHVIKIPKAMKLSPPLPLIRGFILRQCITISLFTLMFHSTPAGNLLLSETYFLNFGVW